MFTHEPNFAPRLVGESLKALFYEKESEIMERKSTTRKKKIPAMKKDAVRMQKHIFKFACVMGVIFVLSGIFVINSSAKEKNNYETYYTSIQIQEGDSLWSLAEKYGSVAFIRPKDYIAEVKRINHIQGDVIHAGEFLTIPYYELEK